MSTMSDCNDSRIFSLKSDVIVLLNWNTSSTTIFRMYMLF